MSFFGGGCDMREWYENHGAHILTSTIDKYCYVCVRRMPPFLGGKYRLMWSKMENVNERDEIEHPAIRGCLEYLDDDEGIEVNHAGDLPARSGLGSSSAFTVSMLSALHNLRGEMRWKRQLADEAIHVEQEVLEETVGIQDQIECAHGGLNTIVIERTGDYRVEPVALAPERRAEFQSHLMLFFTGLTRLSSDISKQNVAAIVSGNKDPELHLLSKLADDALEILCGRGDLRVFGEMLNNAWRMKRRLSPLVTNPQIDEAYERARRAGAIGGKLLGAGGGGFMLLFVKPEDRSYVSQALNDHLEIPVKFESGGAQTVFADER